MTDPTTLTPDLDALVTELAQTTKFSEAWLSGWLADLDLRADRMGIALNDEQRAELLRLGADTAVPVHLAPGLEHFLRAMFSESGR